MILFYWYEILMCSCCGTRRHFPGAWPLCHTNRYTPPRAVNIWRPQVSVFEACLRKKSCLIAHRKLIKGFLSSASYPEGCLKSKRITNKELALLENNNYWRKRYGSSPRTNNVDQVFVQTRGPWRTWDVAQAIPHPTLKLWCSVERGFCQARIQVGKCRNISKRESFRGSYTDLVPIMMKKRSQPKR